MIWVRLGRWCPRWPWRGCRAWGRGGTAVAEGVGVRVGALVGVGVGADVGAGVSVGAGIAVGVGVLVGSGVGSGVAAEVGVGVGVGVGVSVGVGVGVGVGDGSAVGGAVGSAVAVGSAGIVVATGGSVGSASQATANRMASARNGRRAVLIRHSPMMGKCNHGRRMCQQLFRALACIELLRSERYSTIYGMPTAVYGIMYVKVDSKCRLLPEAVF